MDATEKIVQAHLQFRDLGSVVFEPDGNIPPDFLVGTDIAVEARRLNQNHFDNSATKGLEEVSIPLMQRIRKWLENLGPPTDGQSWFISYRYHRPVPCWKELEPILCGSLQNFDGIAGNTGRDLVERADFRLTVYPASKVFDTKFVLGGWNDLESGGWLLYEVYRNLVHCIEEKTAKVEDYRAKYRYWWLALVDYIGFSLSEEDRGDFLNMFSVEHQWDKVLLIDPTNHERHFEI